MMGKQEFIEICTWARFTSLQGSRLLKSGRTEACLAYIVVMMKLEVKLCVVF